MPGSAIRIPSSLNRVQGYLLITGRCVGAEMEMKSAEQELSRVGDPCILKIQWVCNLWSSNYIEMYN